MDDGSRYDVNVLDDDDDRSIVVVVMWLRLNRDQYLHQVGIFGT